MAKFIAKIKTSEMGSTLMQIPVILAIIGGLATFSANNATDVMPEARDVRRNADAYQITMALNFYYDDNLTYPIYLESNHQASWAILEKELVPKYIQALPNDPLAQDYLYRYWSDGHKAKIYYYSEVESDWHERWAY